MDSDEVAGYAIIKETEKAAGKMDEFWERYSTAPDFVDKLLNIKKLCWWHGNHALFFSICERFAEELPDHPQAMQMGVDEVVGYIHLNTMDKAAERLEQFWARYSGREGFIEKVRSINETCWQSKHYDLYFSICRRVVEAFPVHPLSVGMLADEVAGYAIIKEPEKAAAKLDELWLRYSTAPDFIDKLLNIKNISWWNESFDLYFAICDRIAQDFSFDPLTMRTRKDGITGHLALNEWALAEEKLNQFLLDYAGDERMIESLNEIARLYNEKGHYQRGEELYRHALSLVAPDDRSPVMTLAGLIVSQIGRDEAFAAIEAQVDELILQYADDPNGLAEAVFMVGEEYYRTGRKARENTDREKAAECYLKATKIWQWNIEHIADERYFSEACYFGGVAYRHIDEYEQAIGCFQLLLEKTPDFNGAWDAQYLIADCLDKLREQNKLSYEEAKSLVFDACAKLEELYPGSPAGPTAAFLMSKYTK